MIVEHHGRIPRRRPGRRPRGGRPIHERAHRTVHEAHHGIHKSIWIQLTARPVAGVGEMCPGFGGSGEKPPDRAGRFEPAASGARRSARRSAGPVALRFPLWRRPFGPPTPAPHRPRGSSRPPRDRLGDPGPAARHAPCFRTRVAKAGSSRDAVDGSRGMEMSVPGGTKRATSAESLRALDALNVFLADVRDGLGPYLAIYLTMRHWDPGRIGIAMSAMGIATVAAQTPAGAFVDRTRHKRLAIAVAAAAVGVLRSRWSPSDVPDHPGGAGADGGRLGDLRAGDRRHQPGTGRARPPLAADRPKRGVQPRGERHRRRARDDHRRSHRLRGDLLPPGRDVRRDDRRRRVSSGPGRSTTTWPRGRCRGTRRRPRRLRA